MNLSFISIFLVFNVVSNSLAQIPGRFAPSCGYLSQKIYCVGGSTGSNKDYSYDSSVMYLDIVHSSGNTTEELASRWTTIAANTNGVNIQSRRFPQYMVLPDSKTMLLSGGWNSDKSGLVSQTIAYDADSNSWSQYPSYTEPPFGVRQIYFATSVYVPEYGVGFYGGIETNINRNWTYRDQNMSQYEFPNDITARGIGYTSLTFFDIRKSVDPWLVFPTQYNLPTFFSSSQTSIFDELSKRIFFFGGTYTNTTAREFPYHSLASSITFDVNSGTWGSQSLSGFPPSRRTGHTTTLLSSTNRDVLLYGGESYSDGSKPSLDYLFTLNLDSYVWKQQNIHNPEASNLIRTQHSAVPVYNNTLFIVFGRDERGASVSTMVILNVTDPSNVSYLNTYVDPNDVGRPNVHEVEKPSSSSGLSEGITAGIAVGTIVAVSTVCIIISALLCVWKRNRDKKKKEDSETPVMEVNWEEIDKNFTANPATDFSSHRRMIDDEVTAADNKSELYTHQVVTPEGVDTQRPDVIENDAKRPLSVLPMMPQKPDGGL